MVQGIHVSACLHSCSQSRPALHSLEYRNACALQANPICMTQAYRYGSIYSWIYPPVLALGLALPTGTATCDPSGAQNRKQHTNSYDMPRMWLSAGRLSISYRFCTTTVRWHHEKRTNDDRLCRRLLLNERRRPVNPQHLVKQRRQRRRHHGKSSMLWSSSCKTRWRH